MELSNSMSCGWWGCRPKWLQRFATPRGFLWVYGFLGTTQTMAYLYFVATLTTMERRFKIPSKTTGLILSGNEISQILLALILTYFGGRGNRPRWIAWGVAISALSCFILALPHALYGPGTMALSLTQEYVDAAKAEEAINTSPEEMITGQTDSRLCGLKPFNFSTEIREDFNYSTGLLDELLTDMAEQDEQTCLATHEADTQDGNYSKVPLLLVFLSQFVLGIGTTLYYALGQIYLDDNSRKTNTPLLLATTFALRTLGPALGFALGFACLSMYVDPTLTPLIDKKDPRWIGAWWVGWIILGITMLGFALLISLFPRHLPPPSSRRKIFKDGKESSVSDKLLPPPPEHEKPTLKEFPVALRRLLNNKLLMSNIVSSMFYILGASAYITFSTKYIEVQYNQSAAGASMLAGTGGLIAMVVGFLASGIVISKYRPRPRILLFWNVIAGMTYVVAEISFIFLGCPDYQMHGTNNITGRVQLLAECNTGCNCPSDLHFSPVCIGNTTFYSPCHAGCTSANITNLGPNMTYFNCQCAMDAFEPNLNMTLDSIVAKDGPCVPNCGAMFIAFIIVTFSMHMIGSSSRVGNILVNFRCVEPHDKAFAQGLALVVISLFAFIPGPILFGAIIDSTCIIWNESCGRKGNCILYNKYDFRLYISVTAASITTIAVVFDLIVWYLGKDLKLYDEDEDSPNKR